MNISNPSYLLALIFTLFFNSVLANERLELENAHYHELCNIYKSIVNKPIDLSSKEAQLIESVQNKLPILFNQLYVHISDSDADRRYKLLKQYAKQQNNIIWECEVARKYYATQFGSH